MEKGRRSELEKQQSNSDREATMQTYCSLPLATLRSILPSLGLLRTWPQVLGGLWVPFAAALGQRKAKVSVRAINTTKGNGVRVSTAEMPPSSFPSKLGSAVLHYTKQISNHLEIHKSLVSTSRTSDTSSYIFYSVLLCNTEKTITLGNTCSHSLLWIDSLQ